MTTTFEDRTCNPKGVHLSDIPIGGGFKDSEGRIYIRCGRPRADGYIQCLQSTQDSPGKIAGLIDAFCESAKVVQRVDLRIIATLPGQEAK